MAVAGLDPVSPPVTGHVQAPPGGRRRAVCRLAVGASDADEAKAPSRSRVECLGVMGRGHGSGAAGRRASATASAISAPAAWTAAGSSTLPQANFSETDERMGPTSLRRLASWWRGLDTSAAVGSRCTWPIDLR